MKKRTVVSGGTGYVGRFIVECLLAAGHHVTVLGRKPPVDGFFSGPVAFQPYDLDRGGLSPQAFDAASFLVHAAFDHLPGRYRGGEGDDPQSFRRRNLDSSVALFEAARAAGLRHAVFLSSRAVYGPYPDGVWLDETTEARPDTLYGEVKLTVERCLSELAGKDFSGTSLRVTGVYGPAGRGQAHKWADLFSDYLAGREIAPRAGTEVHGADVAEAVRLVLESSGPVPDLLNVSDMVLDRHELLGIVKDLTGSPHPLPLRADIAAVNAMHTARLRGLGWTPGGTARLRATVTDLLGIPPAPRSKRIS